MCHVTSARATSSPSLSISCPSALSPSPSPSPEPRASSSLRLATAVPDASICSTGPARRSSWPRPSFRLSKGTTACAGTGTLSTGSRPPSPWPLSTATSRQGLSLVHFSSQRKRFLWDRGCIRGCSGGVSGELGWFGCPLCQKRLKLSFKVDECKPLHRGQGGGSGARPRRVLHLRGPG
jgi:hypothetical protein